MTNEELAKLIVEQAFFPILRAANITMVAEELRHTVQSILDADPRWIEAVHTTSGENLITPKHEDRQKELLEVNPDCLFNFCPHPDLCNALDDFSSCTNRRAELGKTNYLPDIPIITPEDLPSAPTAKDQD